MHPVTIFYAVLCGACLVGALHTPREHRAPAVLAALALTLNCAWTNIGWPLGEESYWRDPDAMSMAAILLILWWWTQRWLVPVAAVAVAAMGVHFIFEQFEDIGPNVLYEKHAILNALFVIELACVGGQGASGVWDNGKRWFLSFRHGRFGPRSVSNSRSQDQQAAVDQEKPDDC